MRSMKARVRAATCKMDGCNTSLTSCLALFLASCAAPDTQHQIVVSTREQKLALLDRGNVVGNLSRLNFEVRIGRLARQPFHAIGQLQIAKKIGDNAPPGAVFKRSAPHGRNCCRQILPAAIRSSRAFSGCVDWRRKMPMHFARDIYIHGTPEERRSERQRATDAFECAPATSFNCTTS